MTQTSERPSTNRVDHKKKLSNSGMEHHGTCGSTHIKEHTEFSTMYVANSESIKREGSLVFRSFLISRPMKLGLMDTVGRISILTIAKNLE